MKKLHIALFSIAASSLLLTGCSGANSSDSAAESSTVTVETLKGDVEVPADPERLVVLNTPAADAAAELGTTPVAVATSQDELNPWQEGVFDEIADESLTDEKFAPNVEKVAEYEPDVIFAAPWNIPDDSTYDQLSDIAPVVIVKSESTNPDWDLTTELVGEVLGKKDEADDLISTTKEAMAAQGKDLGAEGKTYQLISPRTDGIYFGNASPLELFGLEPGQHQTPEEVNKFTLSAENLDQLDADYLFIWAMDDESKKSVEDNPAFDSLPSVENGSMKFIDADFATAINAASPASLNWLIEDSGITEVLSE